jgi:oxygen-dependent protoporphyrinogen oxidase
MLSVVLLATASIGADSFNPHGRLSSSSAFSSSSLNANNAFKMPDLFGSNGQSSFGSTDSKKIEEVDALVVGSGISGATAAYYLDKQGVDVLLTEIKDEVGGNLISKKEDGYLWEEGPNSFQPTPTILRFAKDVGMIDELVLADSTLPRFVFWEDKLYALPGGLKDLPFFNLLTWPGKIRAGLGALGMIASPPAEEETIKDFVTRHLGAETFTRIIDPFVSGVYAGDPSKLSMRAALKKVFNLERLGVNSGILSGAIVRMDQLAAEKKKNAERDADLPNVPGGSLGSFKNGLQSLPLGVKGILGEKVRLQHKLVGVEQDADGSWVATFKRGASGATKKIRAKAVVMTAPSHVTAPMISGDGGPLPEAAELDDIYYPPVASVTISYPNEAFKNGYWKDGSKGGIVGFGHLIPRAMKTRTLGTIWSSSLFPGRAPEGRTMLLNYIGGAQDPEIANLSPEEIVAQVHEDVKKILLKPDAEPPRTHGVRVWPRAIPQYNKGHLEILDRVVTAGAEKAPGLFLGGNYRTGVAFGDCVQYGFDCATEVATFLTDVEASKQVLSESSEIDRTQVSV